MNLRTAIASTRIESSKRLATAAIVGALSLAACGGDTAPDTFEAGPDNRAALAAEADRYVDLQETRAAEASAAAGTRPANQAALAAEADRYVELQRNRAAEPASADRITGSVGPRWANAELPAGVGCPTTGALAWVAMRLMR